MLLSPLLRDGPDGSRGTGRTLVLLTARPERCQRGTQAAVFKSGHTVGVVNPMTVGAMQMIGKQQTIATLCKSPLSADVMHAPWEVHHFLIPEADSSKPAKAASSS